MAATKQDLNEAKRKLVSKSALRVIDLDTIRFDPSYQREVKSKHKRIVTSFNPDALGIILVGEREDATLWCVDGRQRITALAKMSRKTVRAEVFKSDGPEHEAQVFKLVNMNRMALTPQEQFKALLTGGDKLAWKVKEAVEKAGFRIRTTSTGRMKGDSGYRDVTAIKTLLMYGGRYGTDPIKFALETIMDAWPDDRVANCNNMLAGLMIFFNQKKGVVDNDRLLPRLKTVTPHKILYAAAQEAVTEKQSGSVAIVIARIYVKQLKKAK